MSRNTLFSVHVIFNTEYFNVPKKQHSFDFKQDEFNFYSKPMDRCHAPNMYVNCYADIELRVGFNEAHFVRKIPADLKQGVVVYVSTLTLPSHNCFESAVIDLIRQAKMDFCQKVIESFRNHLEPCLSRSSLVGFFRNLMKPDNQVYTDLYRYLQCGDYDKLCCFIEAQPAGATPSWVPENITLNHLLRVFECLRDAKASAEHSKVVRPEEVTDHSPDEEAGADEEVNPLDDPLGLGPN